jgi:O-acetyl-ADP-ribose deacetylase (regulator of RNase III)
LILPDTNTEITFTRGTVTDFKGESIVNAANEQCLGGGGVDGAITRTGGESLASYRRQLPILYDNVRVPMGDARITKGGDLNASYCIHAVGPDFNTIQEPYNVLDASYVSVLREAKMNQLKEIAFIPLSAGIYRGKEKITKVIKKGLEAILNNTYNGLERVYIYGFKDEEMETFHTLYIKLKKMIS